MLGVRLLMRRALLIAYLAAPAVALVIVVGSGPWDRPVDVAEWLVLPLMLIANYGYFAAPYLAWFLFTRSAGPVLSIVHAGYLGATAALGLFLWWLTSTGGPLTWLLYWPCAGISMAATVGLASLWPQSAR